MCAGLEDFLYVFISFLSAPTGESPRSSNVLVYTPPYPKIHQDPGLRISKPQSKAASTANGPATHSPATAFRSAGLLEPEPEGAVELDVPLPPFAEPPLVGEGGAVEEPEGSEAEDDVVFVPFRRIALRCDVTTQYRQLQDL